MVQQQALRDFNQAMQNYFAGTHRRPTWRKAGRHEGFRVVAVRPTHVRRLNRNIGAVLIPKSGWVRFRWSRDVPDGVKSFDVIRVEDLNIKSMTRSAKGTVGQPGRNVSQKAGLNREIFASGWGLLVRRLNEKVPDRVQKINSAFTSQRCSGCGHVDWKSRESQAVFRCITCGFACNADVNAARNIAAGHAVTARGGDGVARPVNREPQHGDLLVAGLESAALGRAEDVKT
jgi:transposase